ncbi:MAG: hypothetical protein NTW61_06050, partial [Candidatus Melainabacteria bacterium]|nr:hypothetical protein [Candidatus Melainabacteria bacterium]
ISTPNGAFSVTSTDEFYHPNKPYPPLIPIHRLNSVFSHRWSFLLVGTRVKLGMSISLITGTK